MSFLSGLDVTVYFYLDHKELDKIKESRIQRYIYIYHYICNYAFYSFLYSEVPNLYEPAL